MTNTVGRSVRLYLVEGTATGLITAEIMNWTGHVLAGARSGLAKFLERPELDRTGIYFLTGRDPEDPDTSMVYIGESDNVRKRLAQHNKDETKVFWERTCVVTNKDLNFTKAHARYLEARLIAIAKEVGRGSLSNGTAPDAATLPEADQSDMEYFIEQIRLVLPVLGFEFLRSLPQVSPTARSEASTAPTSESPLFELSSPKHGVAASAREVDGEFVVLEGSSARDRWSANQPSGQGYSKLHARLLDQGRLVADGPGLLRFVADTPFSSPSAASAVILGRADNGRTSWRVSGTGKTYAEWQESQVDETQPGFQGLEEQSTTFGS